ncbi:MAG: 1-acyl-sn-glycerol-3-phosphate acyltransferase [Spirochaetes bacterium]|nr:1-acyl-sn-glycerol-3-phosphate acyltransferase [Spirochaetota bacterium]MBU1081147.1 1-acyl-sn-glycerol-3-phosphate acyltransferase [Spirochaetota bacterium]
MSPYRAIYHIVKLLFPRMRFERNGVEIVEPAIFVANHENAFGPIALFLYFPVKLYPWVMHDLTDRQKCARYLEKEFVSKELRLPGPFSTWLSVLMADLCVGLFRYMEAIPVYRRSRRIMETISRSIVMLEEGKSLLIFPEIPDAALTRYINRFNIGFIELAKEMGKEEHKTIRIYPVSVDRARRRIALGRPSAYDVDKSYDEEKRRIEAELEAEVEAMLEGK